MAVGLPKYRNRTSSCTGTRSRTRFSELSRPRGRLFSTGSPTASCLLIRRMPYSTLPHEFLAFGEGAACGKRILSPWTVDIMCRNSVGDLFNGQIGRPPKGVGFGLGGEVVVSAVEARLRKPDGSYGWDGAYGTYWWVNRKEQMVVVMFVQTPGRSLQYDFDNAVSKAVIE